MNSFRINYLNPKDSQNDQIAYYFHLQLPYDKTQSTSMTVMIGEKWKSK